MPAFQAGAEAYVGRHYANPYSDDSVAAQAWDRGLEAAMRFSWQPQGQP